MIEFPTLVGLGDHVDRSMFLDGEHVAKLYQSIPKSSVFWVTILRLCGRDEIPAMHGDAVCVHPVKPWRTGLGIGAHYQQTCVKALKNMTPSENLRLCHENWYV